VEVTVGRPQSVGEEIANAVSHGVGFVVSLGAGPVLIVHASRLGGQVELSVPAFSQQA
jgi:hemolysin III